jgi:uncharacterized membrane protein
MSAELAFAIVLGVIGAVFSIWKHTPLVTMRNTAIIFGMCTSLLALLCIWAIFQGRDLAAVLTISGSSYSLRKAAHLAYAGITLSTVWLGYVVYARKR